MALRTNQPIFAVFISSLPTIGPCVEFSRRTTALENSHRAAEAHARAIDRAPMGSHSFENAAQQRRACSNLDLAQEIAQACGRSPHPIAVGDGASTIQE